MHDSQTLRNVKSSGLLREVTPICVLVALAGAYLLTGCGTAKITGEQQMADAHRQQLSVVYVADFGLVPEEIQDHPGILSDVPLLKRPADEFLYGQKPPTDRARELVNLMSTSLVKDLETSGYHAVRYDPENPLPTNGWLVRGMYTKVQEGNRLRRAMIGFGAGKTDVQVVSVFNELSKGPPEPICQVDTTATSGDLPGSGPTLVLGPYGATARFLLAGTDLERNVRETARRIKEALLQEMDQAE